MWTGRFLVSRVQSFTPQREVRRVSQIRATIRFLPDFGIVFFLPVGCGNQILRRSTLARHGPVTPRRMRRIGRLARRLRVLLPVLRGASVDAATRGPARSVERVQRPGNRNTAARTRHPPATNPPSSYDVNRPALSRGRQPTPVTGPLVGLHLHAGNAAAVASALGGETVDVRASSRSPADTQ